MTVVKSDEREQLLEPVEEEQKELNPFNLEFREMVSKLEGGLLKLQIM